MKNYKLVSLFLPLFVFVLLGSSVNTADASNCASGEYFHTITGQPCNSSVSVQQDDSSASVATFNSLFNSSFKVGIRGDKVKALQQFLKDEGYYFGKVDGKYGRISARAVKDFQEDNELTTTTPQPVTPPIPSENCILYGTGCNYPTTQPSVTILGPVGVKVGEEVYKIGGTLPIKYSISSAPDGAYLKLALVGGPTPVDVKSSAVSNGTGGFDYSISKTGCYTDYCDYFKAGTYNLEAILYDRQPCGPMAMCDVPTATVIAKATSNSFPINDSFTQPSITVLSPNGGETLLKGEPHTIKWLDSEVSNCTGSNCASTYNIKLVPTCTAQVCTMYYTEYTIAEGVYGSSYDWSVGKNQNTYPDAASNGAYTIKICRTGSEVCGSSGSYFKITDNLNHPLYSDSASVWNPGCLSAKGYSTTTGKVCSSH